VSVEITLTRPAAENSLRACQCGFCRPRGTRTVADPNGLATLSAAAPDRLMRYQFGFRTANYLLCRTCGTYVAAVLEAEGRRLSVVNVGGLDIPEFRNCAAERVDYDRETIEERLARRQAKWMPIAFHWTGG
jgi:hypothetical protein